MGLRSIVTASAWQVVAPGLVLGGALVAGGALWAMQEPASRTTAAPMTAYRLSLRTESAARCYYGSVWNEGDVLLAHDASDGRMVTLTSHYDFEDGCTWAVTEVLTPLTAGGYSYSYRERPIACPAGARVARACQRDGRVDVSPAE